MLIEVSGDILLSGAEAVAHGVAPGDHFDSGLALALRERWPAMYKDFRHFCKVHSPHPGDAWSWKAEGAPRIICLFTQEPAPSVKSKPGAATHHNVNVSLKKLAKEIRKKKIKSVALPRLATGVGRLPWNEVRPLIVNHLDGLGVPIVIYTEFRAGQKANEKLPRAR